MKAICPIFFTVQVLRLAYVKFTHQLINHEYIDYSKKMHIDIIQSNYYFVNTIRISYTTEKSQINIQDIITILIFIN